MSCLYIRLHQQIIQRYISWVDCTRLHYVSWPSLLDVEQELSLRGDGGAAGELAAPGPGLGLELDVGLLVPGLEAHSLGLAARAAAAANRPGLLPLCTVLLQLDLDTNTFYFHIES